MNKLKLDCNHEEPSFSVYPETYVKLAKNRIIFVSEDINNIMAAQLSAMLLYFDNEDHGAMIEMYIHSNGGESTGLANIYDVMQMIRAPIKTICIGKCYSAAAVLLSAGTKGERYAFKNSSIMIHGIQAAYPIIGYDMAKSNDYYDFLVKDNDNIMNILAKHTGNNLAKVKEDCKQDIWMDAKQALAYGLIDYIVG